MESTKVAKYVNLTTYKTTIKSQILNLEVAFLWLQKCNFVKVQKMHLTSNSGILKKELTYQIC